MNDSSNTTFGASSLDERTPRGISTAVLLVGGMGTRLRSVVPSTPKPLASIGKRSFLELLVRQLRSQGIRRLVMCTGYLGEQIHNLFGNGADWGVTIEYSQEHDPLGTAGAIKLAQRHLCHLDNFIVMNGDSFLQVDFAEMTRIHHGHRGLVTMAVAKVNNTDRYGTIQFGENGRVTAFLEKTGHNVPGVVNAGVYVFARAVLDFIPEGPASLEKDVFPRLLSKGIYALEQPGMFIDIGTPEDYAQAKHLCERLFQATEPAHKQRI